MIDARKIKNNLAFILTKQILNQCFDFLALTSQGDFAGELQQRNIRYDALGIDLQEHGVEIQHTPIRGPRDRCLE